MTPRPIFIVGSGRSGTSVLTWAIGQHPNVIAVPETDWKTALASWADGLHKIGMAQQLSGHLARWQVTREAFLEHLGTAIDTVIKRSFEARFPDRKKCLTEATVRRNQLWFRSVDDPKTRWVDGTPSSTGYAAVLAAMFPEAHFINLVRNPESVVKSWMGASFRAADLRQAKDLVAHVYHAQRAGYLVDSTFENRSMRVIFEELTGNPEKVIRTILEHLDENYSADCIEPLAEKINSSGDASEKVLAEYQSIAESFHMKQMIDWYRSTTDPSWKLEPDAIKAAEALAEYAKYRIPLPD